MSHTQRLTTAAWVRRAADGPARDALHAAVMKREGITRLMSFDGGFDSLPGLTRRGA